MIIPGMRTPPADTSAPTETVAPTTEQTSQEVPSDGTTTP